MNSSLSSIGQTSSPLPKGGTLRLRNVAPQDDEFLLSVYFSTRAEELAQAEWQEGQEEAFVKWQFEMQRREYDARFPDAEYYVILIDDVPAGRMWIGADSEQIRLLDIAILPAFQNRGAGTILIRRLIDVAAATKKSLRHMVFVLNNDAHRFYERLGFVVIEDLGAYKHMEWKSEPPGDRGPRAGSPLGVIGRLISLSLQRDRDNRRSQAVMLHFVVLD